MNLSKISFQPGTTHQQIERAWRMARESVLDILNYCDGDVSTWEVIDAVTECCSINGVYVDDKTALRFARRIYRERYSF